VVDEKTFVGEVTAMERTLYRVSRSMLNNWADCADAVQEALKKAWEKRGRAEEAYFRAWLMRIVINECRNVQRQKSRMVAMAEVPQSAQMEAPDTALRDAVMGLPEKFRLPLILNCLEGFTVAEAARMLAIPEGTVKWRLSKARELLRKEIDETEAQV
jgi:RNA polymerase sigma-70 factor (ECF subfamily)